MAGGGFRKGTVYSKLLQIKSSERDSGTTSNFSINMGQQIKQVSQISIQNVVFHNNFYNIWYNTATDNNNNMILQLTEAGGPTTTTRFTIPPGFYTAIDLMTLIVNQWNTLYGTFGTVSWTFNDQTNLFTLTYTQVGGFITAATFAPVTGIPDWPFPYLGFSAASVSIGVSGVGFPATYTAQNFPRMSGPTLVEIQSVALSPANAFDEKGKFSDTLVSIPVTSGFLGLNVMECKVDALCEIFYGRPRDLSTIDIKLCDRTGRVLDLHGGSLNIELRLWFNSY